MDFNLSQEDQDFFERFCDFCRKEIAPLSLEAEQEGQLLKKHWQLLSECGYLGLLFPANLGGQEASNLQAVLAQVALAESCGSTFFSSGASAGLFGRPLCDYGTAEQKAKYLPGIMGGKLIGALAVTEPAAGSDVQGLTTRAIKTPSGYVLSGQKTYITNAPVCDVALVLARIPESSDGSGGLTHFIVDMNGPGISRGKPLAKMGLHGSPTGEIFLDDAPVEANAVLGRAGTGFRITMEAFNRERLALAAYAVGSMAACLLDSLQHSRSRKSFGRPIGKHQSVAFMLSDMAVKYEAAKWMLLETAWLVDQAGPARKIKHNGESIDLTARAAEAKLLSSTFAREVANLAVQVHGGMGYMEETRVCRIYRDIKLAEIGGGTSEIQKQIIARSAARSFSQL